MWHGKFASLRLDSVQLIVFLTAGSELRQFSRCHKAFSEAFQTEDSDLSAKKSICGVNYPLCSLLVVTNGPEER